MKKFLSLSFIVIALAALVGCGTVVSTQQSVTSLNGVLVTNLVTTTNATILNITVTPQAVYNTLRAGTSTGAKIAIGADTNSLAYLQAVRLVLGTYINGTNYSLANLTTAINALPITSIKNQNAIDAINAGFTAFVLLEPILQQQIGGQNRFVLPALQGVYDGIGDALGIIAPTPIFSTESIVIPQDAWCDVTNELTM